MTYEKILNEAAKKLGISQRKANALLTDVCGKVAKNALNGGKPLRLPLLGFIATRPVRSSGRKVDGTKWEAASPRMKLTLRTTITHEVKKQESAATGVSGVAA